MQYNSEVNLRDQGGSFLGGREHGFEHVLLVILGPLLHRQLCDLQRPVVHHGNLAVHHVLVIDQLHDGTSEVLVARQLE